MKNFLQSIMIAFALLLTGLDVKAEEGDIDATSYTELQCLALNLYHEGRGESLAGQEAIAKVTLNRVLDKRFPSTVCDVVWQNNMHKGKRVAQFSWTLDGRSDKIGDKLAYSKMMDVANVILWKYMWNVADTLNNSLYYHADHITPKWDYSKLTQVASIGNHIIYKDR